jgi:hypothetical protein
MATNSILREVYIKNKADGNKTVAALEVASNRTGKKVSVGKTHKDIKDAKKIAEMIKYMK